MKTEISNKIKNYFASMAIYKDPASTNSLFAGRNLPSFVKDFILKKYINTTGQVDRCALTAFLDNVIPQEAASVKDRLGSGQELTLLTRFIIYIDLVKGIRRFAIPDLGIKLNEGQIPDYVYNLLATWLMERSGALLSFVSFLIWMAKKIMSRWLITNHSSHISQLT